MTTICDDCNQPCEIIMIDDSFDYAGTHCTGGMPGRHHVPPYAGSECCEAEFTEVEEEEEIT